VGAVAAIALANIGVSVIEALASVAAMCIGAAILSWRLHRACDGVNCTETF